MRSSEKSNNDRVSALPIWGKSAIPSHGDKDPGDDKETFWSVITIFIRSWPFIKPQVFCNYHVNGFSQFLKLPDHPLLSWRTLFFVPRQIYIAFLWAACSIIQIIFRIFGKKIRLSYGEPGHVCYFFFVEKFIGLLLAYPLLVLADIMTQVILIGRKMTETQAWLLGLDMASYTGVGQLIPDQRYQVLFIHIGITLGIRFFLIPILVFMGYYKTWILQRMNQDLRMALIDRWLLLSLRYHSDHRVGDSVYRIYQDSAMVTNVIIKVYEGFHSLTKFLTAALVVYFFNPLLSMLIILGVLPIMAWGLWYSPRMRAYSLVSREANSALVSRIQEIFSGIRVIKAYGSEAREQTNFEKDSVIAFNSSYRVRSLMVLITIVGFTLISLLLVIPTDFIMALWASRGADIYAIQLVAFLGLSYVAWNLSAFTYGKERISGAISSIRHLMYSWSQAQDMAVGLIRVFDILDIEPEVKDKEAAIPMPEFHHVVEFNRVSFSYEKDKPVLTDSSFRAEIGTINAIVGPTGCGKSTLMILLLRLFDPDNGSISIDGTDLRDFQMESLRENISIALQENILFGMSVAENIRYNNPMASDEDVKAVAEIACADEFIRSLPDGYNTLLGDRGGKLSTGQRQRLSIARALIKDCDILILDEPTAALDAETEHRVLANLAQWGKDKVILLITHRISTIQQANQIMYLDKGRIQESGSHSELISITGGYYRRFVEQESEAAETSGDA